MHFSKENLTTQVLKYFKDTKVLQARKTRTIHSKC